MPLGLSPTVAVEKIFPALHFFRVERTPQSAADSLDLLHLQDGISSKQGEQRFVQLFAKAEIMCYMFSHSPDPIRASGGADGIRGREVSHKL
jgi:hypothetical protein